MRTGPAVPGPRHRAAEVLVAEVLPNGREAAGQLRRLLNVKDAAQYGFIHVSGSELRGVLRQAHALVDFAQRVLSR